MDQAIENMSSAELKAKLESGTVGGTTPSKTGKVKAKAIKAKPAAKSKSKTSKAPAKSKAKTKAAAKSKPKSKAKPAAKSKAKASKPAAPSIISKIGDYMIANKGEAFKATDLAKRFKCRGVEVHRAVARLERLGATVSATRSGPTGKPGRRTFLYSLDKNPTK